MKKYYTRACNFYYGTNAKNLIKKKLAFSLCGNKNIYPSNKEDLKVEDDDKDSALSSIGLKPKIVH